MVMFLCVTKSGNEQNQRRILIKQQKGEVGGGGGCQNRTDISKNVKNTNEK